MLTECVSPPIRYSEPAVLFFNKDLVWTPPRTGNNSGTWPRHSAVSPFSSRRIRGECRGGDHCLFVFGNVPCLIWCLLPRARADLSLRARISTPRQLSHSECTVAALARTHFLKKYVLLLLILLNTRTLLFNRQTTQTDPRPVR